MIAAYTGARWNTGRNAYRDAGWRHYRTIRRNRGGSSFFLKITYHFPTIACLPAYCIDFTAFWLLFGLLFGSSFVFVF